jgi:hypothetical protein
MFEFEIIAILFLYISYLHFEWCKFQKDPKEYWKVMLEIRRMKMKKC